MLGSITKHQFEQMRQQLIVPLAVSDILRHDLPVEADMQYGLHMALSEVDPDSALLAIAICAQDLAARYERQIPIASVLKKEADEILSHYAPTWLRYNSNTSMPSYVYADLLDTVPEDLEGLADLLDALSAELEEGNATVTLTNLLSIQARAHMEIADYVLAEIAYEKQVQNQPQERPNFGYQTRDEESASFAGDNIILFPGVAG